MRITAVLLLLLLVPILSLAQGGGTAPLGKGDRQVNFGTGFTNHGLPVYGSFDFAVHKDVTLTPEVHIRFDDPFKVGSYFKADYHWNYLLGIPPNWDFYAGLRAGFDFGDEVDFALGVQVGGRWYWSDRWGINLEFGGGPGIGTTFGLSAKM